MNSKKQVTPPIPPIWKMGGIYGSPNPMASLFEKYRVSYGNHLALSWALAEAHEPGFKATKTGRPRDMDPHLFCIIVEVLANAENPSKVSDRAFAKALSRKLGERAPHWETLRKHLPKARAFAEDRRRRKRLVNAILGSG